MTVLYAIAAGLTAYAIWTAVMAAAFRLWDRAVARDVVRWRAERIRADRDTLRAGLPPGTSASDVMAYAAARGIPASEAARRLHEVYVRAHVRAALDPHPFDRSTRHAR